MSVANDREDKDPVAFKTRARNRRDLSLVIASGVLIVAMFVVFAVILTK